jgi:O-antigen ligase
MLVAAAAMLPLLQIGADRLVERYAASAEHLVSDGGRARVWADTLRMASAFPVAGTGFGTFSAAYPAFRSPDVRFFYSHAHNDPIQVAAEGGVPGALLLVVLVVSVLRAVFRGLTGGLGIVGAGVAAGLVGVLLHSLVDFDFHIPANAATAAVLAGLLEGMAWRANGST